MLFDWLKNVVSKLTRVVDPCWKDNNTLFFSRDELGVADGLRGTNNVYIIHQERVQPNGFQELS